MKKIELAVAPKQSSLIELNNRYVALGARLCELGGELTEETEKELEELTAQLCAKADGYGVVIRNLEGNVEVWKRYRDEANSAVMVYQKAIDALKDRMKVVLAQTDGEALQGEIFRFFLAKAADKIDINIDLLPAEYKKSELRISANRDTINAAIAKGEVPAGVTVTPNKSLRTGRPK